MFRDKDILHLKYIVDICELVTPEDMINFIVADYPYIEDEYWWELFRDNVYLFYDMLNE